jgi:glycosyltransferase involved in cell wall biosynthesis
LRIAVVNFNVGLVGGVETYLHDLLPALAARGHALALVHELPAGDDVETLQLDPRSVLDRRWCVAELGVAGLCASLSEWKPDAVYVNLALDPALESALLDRFPAAFYAHTYHGTCVSGTKMFGLPVATPCERRMGLPCLALYLPRRCGGLSPLTAVALYRRQRRRLEQLRRYDAVLVASDHMAREQLKHGIEAARVTVTPPYVDVAPDPSPPSHRRSEGRLLFVGRLTVLKGVDLLIDALPIVQARLDGPIRATVVGDGPARAEVARAAARSGVEIALVGQRTGAEVKALMRDADLLVVPSRWPEPFGLVGVEAAAVGLPAVGFAVGGIRDWLEPGVTGELAAADPPTAGKLADALVAALEDGARHHRLREGAWRAAVTAAGRDHVTTLESVLGHCAKSRQGKRA